jgi:hypothetical protein
MGTAEFGGCLFEKRFHSRLVDILDLPREATEIHWSSEETGIQRMVPYKAKRVVVERLGALADQTHETEGTFMVDDKNFVVFPEQIRFLSSPVSVID